MDLQNREKRNKKQIFIDIMHGKEVEDDAKMNYNHVSKFISQEQCVTFHPPYINFVLRIYVRRK